MILPIYPIPTDSGSKRRMLAFVKGLSKQHYVEVISLGDFKYSDSWIDISQSWKSNITQHKYYKYIPLLRSFISTKTYRETKLSNCKFKKVVSNCLNNNHFDVVWVNFLNMVVYLDKYLDNWIKTPDIKPILLLDQHNVDEIYWKSFLINSKNPFYKLFCFMEAKKNKKLQDLYFPYFDLILSVSESDKKVTEQYGIPSEKVILAPNGVDINYFKPISHFKRTSNPTIVFAGS